MRKVSELDEHFPTGEATVQPVVLWGRNGRVMREKYSAKTASEASDYIKYVEPQAGKSIVLVLALGAYETYDLNRNGDGFNEFPYRTGFKPTCGCCQADGAWVTQEETLPQHYKSFEKFAKVFKHHVNGDPAKNFGDVLKAFWNPQMHRVELLLGIDNAKAPDVVQRIADGEFVAVSMGCKIQYDVCLVCGHRAPTRREYCEHLKFGMRQVTKSGIRAGALNPSPKFFDISIVSRPADQTGYMLKKVARLDPYEIKSGAELGEAMDAHAEKRASLRKLSAIDKIVRGQAVDFKTSPLSEAEGRMLERYRDTIIPAVRRMPTFDDATLKQLAKYPTAKVLSSLSSAGVILTTPEFVRMFAEKMTPGAAEAITDQMLDTIVTMQGHLFDVFAEHPEILAQLEASGAYDVNAENVVPEICGVAGKYLEKRSSIKDYLYRNIVPPALRPDEPAWTDVLNVTDPSTGSTYATTRGAVREMKDEISRKELARIAATAAAMGVGARAVAGAVPKPLSPLVYGATGAAAMAGFGGLRPDYGAHYTSDEGIPVPVQTELAKTSSAGELASSAALVAALGHDYESRLRRGENVHDPRAPIGQRLIARVSGYASENPMLSGASALALLGLLKGKAKHAMDAREKLGHDVGAAGFEALVEAMADLL